MKTKKVIISVIFLSFAAFFSFAQNRAEDGYIDAVQLYSEGRYDKSLELLSKVLSADPSNDAALYYRGLCEMSLGRKAEALETLGRAVKADTSNYWYRDRLARAYMVNGDADMAISEYEKLAERFPKKMDSFYSLTNLYLAKGEYDKAVDAIGDIEAYYGKSDATVLTKYRILLQQQKQEEALNTLKEYSEEYASPQILSMLGDHEMGMYNDSLANAYYDEALALDSGYAPALLGKAEMYRMTRRFPEYFSAMDSIVSSGEIPAAAKADYMGQLLQHLDPQFLSSYRPQLDSTYSIMLGSHPADTSVLKACGIYYFNTGREAEAKEMFRRNADANPSSLDAVSLYVQVLSSSKDYEKLVEVSEKAAGRFPQEKGFDDMVIFGEYSLKNYRKVIEKCEAMMAKAPADSATCLAAYSTIGDMHHLLNDPARAYKAYDKALKINPDYAPVLNNYAYYLSLEGKSLNKAYRMSRKTIEQEPDNATYLDTFGWILHLQGKDVEAKPFFKHAMLYGGKDSATMLAHYAVVLDALGETDLAKVYRSQAKAKAAEEESE